MTHRDDLGSPRSKGSRATPLLLAVVTGVSSAVLTWLFTLSLSEVEAVGALVMLACGLGLDLRAGIHVRQRYLSWRGEPGHRWRSAERRRLRHWTLFEIALAVGLTGVSTAFFLEPAGLVQLGAAIVFFVLVYVCIEHGKRAAALPGGPRPGSDVIESCGPVRYVLHEERIWNGKWGLDKAFEILVERVPVGHRNKVAALLVVGLAVSIVTQVGAVAGRQAASMQPPAPRQAISSGKPDLQVDRRHSRPAFGGERAPQRQPSLDADEERTYEDNCGTEVTPGDGLPRLLRREMRIAWEKLSPASACALRGRPISGGRAFVVPGFCRGTFWSLGLASRKHSAAVLIEDAARAGRRVWQERELLGASARIDLDEGDFHILHTQDGPFVLVREQKTDGGGGTRDTPQSCTEIQRGKERYTVLWPGAAELWLRFNELAQVPAWPFVRMPASAGEQVRFSLKAEGGAKLASGRCSSPADCRLSSPSLGRLDSSAAGARRQVTVGRILEHGPR